jgi:hypothetical protein
MFAILKTSKFDIIFSVVVGFAIMSLTIPMCKGEQCFIKKAPSIEEMKNSKGTRKQKICNKFLRRLNKPKKPT